MVEGEVSWRRWWRKIDDEEEIDVAEEIAEEEAVAGEAVVERRHKS